jgi:hypothetical protein
VLFNTSSFRSGLNFSIWYFMFLRQLRCRYQSCGCIWACSYIPNFLRNFSVYI